MSDSGEEKTEEPSDKKLRDARDKGQVAKSKDLSESLEMMVTLVLVMSMVPWFGIKVSNLFLAVERLMQAPELFKLEALLVETMYLVLVASVPIVAVASVVGLFATWLQIGTILSLDPVMPKLERMNPASGLKNLFSMKSLVQFAQMLLKTGIVGVAVYLVCQRLLPDAIRVIHADIGAALEVVRVSLVQLLLWCGALFLVMGCADYGFQRWNFIKEQRMSMTEVKREHKEQEGDGHMKSERKRVGQEPDREEALKYMNMVVRHSDGRLVVLIYKPAAHERPLYLLRAKGDFADVALAHAKKENVPSVYDDGLMEALYQGVQIAAPIQSKHTPQVMDHLKRLQKS
jgi:flagellar biosynthesis protein FlhB